MLKKYFSALVIILISGSFLLFFCAELSTYYTNQIEQKALEASLSSKDNWVVPSVVGSSMGLDKVFSLKDIKGDHRLISMGTSMSLAGIVDSHLDRIHINASTGSMSIQTLFVMKSYLDTLGIEVQENDVVKIDLSPLMFTKKALSIEVLVSALSYQDIYTVEEDLSVHRNLLSPIAEFYGLKSKAIEKAFTTFKTIIETGSVDALFETSPHSFENTEKFLDFTQNNTALLEALLMSYEGKNLVVDLMFMHPDLQSSIAAQQFNTYVDERLIPFLSVNGIAYLDHRVTYTLSDFADSTHLNGKARLKYTSLIESELKELGYE
ncbi:MAG: hypothetical protein HGB31_04250 [Erysipelotrichaceae bacterium]|nr:hypothetical protein [Erysipelotrichaceae bacterium]